METIAMVENEGLPTHDDFSMLQKESFFALLCEHVGHLVLCWDIANLDSFVGHFISEVVILDADVLRSWAHGWGICKCQCSTVVLKQSTANSWQSQIPPIASLAPTA